MTTVLDMFTRPDHAARVALAEDPAIRPCLDDDLVELYTRWEVDPPTTNVIDSIGLHDSKRIRPGLRADMVLVEGDPTVEVTTLRRIRKVWRNGMEFGREL